MVTGKLIHTSNTMDEGDNDIKNTLGLNEKEIRFLKLAATEMTYKEMAQEMGLNPRAVEIGSMSATLFIARSTTCLPTGWRSSW